MLLNLFLSTTCDVTFRIGIEFGASPFRCGDTDRSRACSSSLEEEAFESN